MSATDQARLRRMALSTTVSAPPPAVGRSGSTRPRPEVHGLAEVVDRLAALPRGGCPPDRAWVLVTSQLAVADDWRVLVPVGEVAAAGGDVPAALDRVAAGVPEVSVAQALRSTALAWRVGAGSGAPLVPVMTRLAAALRDDLQVEADRRVALAGPRSTATVLAWLPVAGLAVSAGLGAVSPVMLVTTPAGLGCLVAGSIALLSGRVWTQRMLLRVQRS